MTAEHDAQILKAAPRSSDDWDDQTWAAWFRHADRVHQSPRDRIAELEAENADLRAKLTVRERQLERLDPELVRLRDEVRELTRCLALNEAEEVPA